jgi:hypothetical protein
MAENRNPREHYSEAERLPAIAAGDFPATPIAADIVALAQVHATLATVDVQALWRLKVRPDHEVATDGD